jgi:hypothetical protein
MKAQDDGEIHLGDQAAIDGDQTGDRIEVEIVPQHHCTSCGRSPAARREAGGDYGIRNIPGRLIA